MTNFRDKLKELRRDAELQHRHRIPLTDEELGLTDGTEQCLLARDEIANEIERLMLDLSAESRQFAISRGFFEGKYSISLSCDELCPDERGELDKCFSRINFLLAPCTSDNSFSITSKITVLNRDQAKASMAGVLTRESDQEKFRSFVESEMLRFAESYFSARRSHPIPAVGD